MRITKCFLPVVGAALVSNAGCRASADQAEGAAHTMLSAERPLVAVIGGFGSCGDDEAPEEAELGARAAELERDLRTTGRESDFFYSCYAGKTRGLELRITNGTAKLASLSVANFAMNEVTKEDFHDAIAAWTDVLERELAGTERPLVLVGHSVGGWTAMQVARRVDLPKRRFRALVTVDPISPVTCNDLKRTPIDFYDTWTTGCQQAPSDVTHEDRLALLAKVGRWVSFYQTDFVLRSGPIDEPGVENVRIAYDRWPFFDAHQAISVDDAVWGVPGAEPRGATIARLIRSDRGFE